MSVKSEIDRIKANVLDAYNAVETRGGTLPDILSTGNLPMAISTIPLGEGGSGSLKVPVGSIVIWSGSADDIPSGWHICDGTDGTPDMRGKFVLGASDSHPVGEEGGEETVALTIDQMPEHLHGLPSLIYGNSTVKIYESGSRLEALSKSADGSLKTHKVGSSKPHNNMPPYYALCYIMKLTADATDGGGGSSNPVGTVISYLGTNAPDDYLLCDGTVYDISAYPNLAKFIGEQFGMVNHFGGDGETTFAVPDMQGRFLLSGSDEYGLGDVGGEKEVKLNHQQMPSHSHTAISIPEGFMAARVTKQSSTTTGTFTAMTSSASNINSTSGSSGGNEPHNNMPPYMVVTYCIKAKETVSSGGPTSSNPGEVYSTEEVRIGTWIDKKPLYRRVVTSTDTGVLSVFSRNDAILLSTVVHGSSEIEQYTRVEGFVIGSNYRINVPGAFYLSSYPGNSGIMIQTDNGICVTKTGLNAKVEGAKELTLILEYTKTTD